MTRAIRIISTVLALLCLLAFVPWTLGIPGTENDYARGWTIGYYAIVFYLLAIAVLGLAQLLAHYAKRPEAQRWIDLLRLASMLGFVVAQIVAWPLILS